MSRMLLLAVVLVLGSVTGLAAPAAAPGGPCNGLLDALCNEPGPNGTRQQCTVWSSAGCVIG